MGTAWQTTRARVRSWTRAMSGRRRLESEMEEEMQFHLEARATDLVREGVRPQDAMRQARLEFGGVASHKDGMRRSLGLRWWDDLWCDVRYAARILSKSPGFTAIAVGSLALAIGANTAIFSLANEVMFERLGVVHPEQLRLFTTVGDKRDVVRAHWGLISPLPGGLKRNDSFSYPVYQELKRENKVLGEIFAFKDNFQANVVAEGSAQAVRLELVSGNLYQEMGVQPVLGRAILPSDDATPGAGAVAVISYGFWERAFGRSADVVGKTITVNMIPVTVVGENPRGFTGAQSVQSSPELFMPLSMIPLLKAEWTWSGPFLSSPTFWWVQLMARDKPGVTTEQARASLDVLLSAAVRGTMKVRDGDTLPKLMLEDGSRGMNFAGRQYGKPMYVLMALVGFVLLLACANIANLMLARASARQREMGVRLALGAGRSRILRQVLTESLMLSAMGGGLGLLLGYLGRSVLPKLSLNAWERTDINLAFDWKVFSFTAGVTLATGVLFGIAPAWAATRAEIGTALKEGGKSGRRNRTGWSGRAVVGFQLALSTLLVVGAGLFLRTLMRLNSIDPGFKADHLVLFDVNPQSKEYSPAKTILLHQRIEDAVRTIPGVSGVALTDVPMVANSMSNSGFILEGDAKEYKNGEEGPESMTATVGQDFLPVMGIPILAGRGFTQEDIESPRAVAVVNQTLARKYFPNQSPIGRRFSADDIGTKDRTWMEIVGVCGDTRYADLKQEPPPLYLTLYRQAKTFGGATYVVRTRMKPEEIAPSLRAAVGRIDPYLPLMDVRTQQQQMDATMQQERMFASLTAGFGALALALACVGIYGIMAYTVSQRTNEIGIRLALGAERGRVRRMVLLETGWLAVLGIMAGLAAALGLGSLVKSMLYGLKPADPASLAAAAGLLMLVALVAGWVPAARASRVEPMEALRHE
jgi:predicted permease